MESFVEVEVLTCVTKDPISGRSKEYITLYIDGEDQFLGLEFTNRRCSMFLQRYKKRPKILTLTRFMTQLCFEKHNNSFPFYLSDVEFGDDPDEESYS